MRRNKTTYNPEVGIATRYARHKAQAKFRGEPYALTKEQYEQIWSPYPDRPGRSKHAMAMVRIDPTMPWQIDNIHMCTRLEYMRSFRTRYVELGYYKDR